MAGYNYTVGGALAGALAGAAITKLLEGESGSATWKDYALGSGLGLGLGALGGRAADMYEEESSAVSDAVTKAQDIEEMQEIKKRLTAKNPSKKYDEPEHGWLGRALMDSEGESDAAKPIIATTVGSVLALPWWAALQQQALTRKPKISFRGGPKFTMKAPKDKIALEVLRDAKKDAIKNRGRGILGTAIAAYGLGPAIWRSFMNRSDTPRDRDIKRYEYLKSLYGAR